MERWEPLGSGGKILTSPRHRLTTDTLLLARFSLPRQGERCADLGAGCGGVALLWCLWGRPAQVDAVELQVEAVRLLERSVEANGLGEKIALLQGDLRDYKALLPHQGLDRMACNPPYYPLGSGARSEGQDRSLARHEEALSLEVLAQCGRYGLKTGGRLCLCLPVARLAEALALFHEQGLEPKRLRLVQLDGARPPYLFLLECRRGGRSGLQAEPTLLLRDETGGDSPELRDMYGDYWKGRP